MDALERLRRANPVPAQDRPPWEALEARLDAEPAMRARIPRPARTRRTLLLAALLLLVLAAGAVAAGILLNGEPLPEPTPRATPTSGTGTARAVELLPVTAPDPDGGPAWGIRLVRTTRGLVCLQLGRRSGGRLGILGQDGAFGNDARFHPISARAPEPWDCALPDTAARPVISGTFNRLPASGRRLGCHPGVPKRGERIVQCPAGSERDVHLGVLGPEATSVTYRDGDRLATRRTTGPHGAYLLVVRSAHRGPISFTVVGAGPDRGLVSVQYRGGRRCVIASPDEGGGRPCSPPASAPAPARDGGPPARATVRATARPTASGQRVDVRFRAPVAIHGARRLYVVSLVLPRASACERAANGPDGPSIVGSEPRTGRVTAYATTDQDLATGALVRVEVPLPHACHGATRGRVDLKRLPGTHPDPVFAVEAPGRIVGRFSVRLGAPY
jgi:hypothetical protein